MTKRPSPADHFDDTTHSMIWDYLRSRDGANDASREDILGYLHNLGITAPFADDMCDEYLEQRKFATGSKDAANEGIDVAKQQARERFRKALKARNHDKKD